MLKASTVVFLANDTFIKAHPVLEKLVLIASEVGLALMIAAIVSFIYDIKYHRSRFESKVDSAVEKVDLAVSEIQAQLGKIDDRVDCLPSVKVLHASGIDRIWKRYDRDQAPSGNILHFDRELQVEIEQAIAQANVFVYVMGRSLNDSIASSHTTGLWLWNAIKERLDDHTRPLEFSATLMDVFGPSGVMTKREIAETPHHRTHLNAVRETIEFFCQQLSQFVGSHAVEVRLIKRPSPFFCVITERVAIVEYYHPYREQGEGVFMASYNKADKWSHSAIAYYEKNPERLQSTERLDFYKSIVRSYVQLRRHDSSACSEVVEEFLKAEERKVLENPGRVNRFDINEPKWKEMKLRFASGLLCAQQLSADFSEQLSNAARKVPTTK